MDPERKYLQCEPNHIAELIDKTVVESGVDKIELWYKTSFSGNLLAVQTTDAGSGANSNDLIFQLTYKV